MKIKPNQYKINNRFSLSSDQWNWVLIEWLDTHNPIRRYYTNLNQLSKSLLDIAAKDSLSRQSITQDKNTSTGGSAELLMSKITQDLELFLKEVTNEKA